MKTKNRKIVTKAHAANSTDMNVVDYSKLDCEDLERRAIKAYYRRMWQVPGVVAVDGPSSVYVEGRQVILGNVRGELARYVIKGPLNKERLVYLAPAYEVVAD